MSATIDARAKPMNWTRPFARFQTQKQARDAAAMGVVALAFQGLGCLILLFRLSASARHAATAAALTGARIEMAADVALIALLTWVGYALVRHQSMWAAWVMVGFVSLEVLSRLQHGVLGLISFPIIIIVMSTILSVRGVLAKKRFVDNLDCF